MVLKLSDAINLSFGSSSLELLSICKLHTETTTLPRILHSHDDRLELVFVNKGSGTYVIDGVNYTTNDGDILIYNAGVLHDEHHMIMDSESEIFGCSIKGVNILGLPTNHLISKENVPKISSGEHQSGVLGLFNLLISYSDKSHPFNKLLVNNLLFSLLILISEITKEYIKPFEGKKIKKIGDEVKRYLDENYWDEIVLSELAGKLNISPFYLSHTFKKYSGYSPLQYLTRRRIGEAQTLLLHSKYSLTQIANAIGFNNVTYFQNVFIKYVGLSPIEYRNILLETASNTYLLNDP